MTFVPLIMLLIINHTMATQIVTLINICIYPSSRAKYYLKVRVWQGVINKGYLFTYSVYHEYCILCT